MKKINIENLSMINNMNMLIKEDIERSKKNPI